MENLIKDTTKYITVTVDNNTKWLDNYVVSTLLTLGLAIYAAMFSDKICGSSANFFNNPYVKIVAFLIIIYLSTRNIVLAFIAMIALFSILIKASMCDLQNKKKNEHFTEITTDDYVYPAMKTGCICACIGGECKCECVAGYDKDSTEDDVEQESVGPETESMINEILVEELETKPINLSPFVDKPVKSGTCQRFVTPTKQVDDSMDGYDQYAPVNFNHN